MVPPGSGQSLPQAAFTFCHHVTPDLARIDCSATCVPGLFVTSANKHQSYCTQLPLVVAVISAARSRVLLLDVGKVSEVIEDFVLSIPVTLRPCVVAGKRGNGFQFLTYFALTCVADSHSYHRRCPLSESQNCQSREWNCQRRESAGSVGAQKSPDIGELVAPGSWSSSAPARRGTFGWSRTENTTLLPRNHILGGLLDGNLHQQTFAGGRRGSGTIFMPPSQILIKW